MRRKYLEDYEAIIGPIKGVDRDLFDTAGKYEKVPVKCECGNEFESSKRDLAARFKRGNNIQCRTCVNRANVIIRHRSK